MLFLDIETVPNEALTHFLPEVAPPGNYKKPESIAQWWAENGEAVRQEQMAKMALDPLLFRLRVIAWADDLAEPEAHVIRDETEELSTLGQFLVHLEYLRRRGTVFPIVGYNIIQFDLPRLLWRSMALNLPLWRPIIDSFDLRKYNNPNILDLMLLLKGGDTRVTSLAGMGLKQVCRLLDIPNDLPDTDGSLVAAMSDQEVKAYAASDIRLLQALYRRMAGIYFQPQTQKIERVF